MTNNFGFTLANPVTHRDALLEINLEYMAWVSAGIEETYGLTSKDLSGLELPDYVASVIDKVCGEPSPRGAFYLVHVKALWPAWVDCCVCYRFRIGAEAVFDHRSRCATLAQYLFRHLFVRTR